MMTSLVEMDRSGLTVEDLRILGDKTPAPMEMPEFMAHQATTPEISPAQQRRAYLIDINNIQTDDDWETFKETYGLDSKADEQAKLFHTLFGRAPNDDEDVMETLDDFMELWATDQSAERLSCCLSFEPKAPGAYLLLTTINRDAFRETLNLVKSGTGRSLLGDVVLMVKDPAKSRNPEHASHNNQILQGVMHHLLELGADHRLSAMGIHATDAAGYPNGVDLLKATMRDIRTLADKVGEVDGKPVPAEAQYNALRARLGVGDTTFTLQPIQTPSAPKLVK